MEFHSKQHAHFCVSGRRLQEEQKQPDQASEILTDILLHNWPGLCLPRFLFSLFPSALFFPPEVTFAGVLHSAMHVVQCTILRAAFIADVAVLKPTVLLATFPGGLQRCKLSPSVREHRLFCLPPSFRWGVGEPFLLSG